MIASDLTVVRDHGRWAVASDDGEILAIARTRRGAEGLARDACRIMRDSGADSHVVPAEPRSFKDK
jgi:hypothetical protein